MALAALALPAAALAAQTGVSRYLVDGRVHVALVDPGGASQGALYWVDTVSGERGDACLASRGDHLELLPPRRGGRVWLVPGAALVIESPPWGRARSPALGIRLD